MSLYVSAPKSNFAPAPEGLHRAVCCDVQDRGEQTTSFGPRQEVEVRWLLEEKNEEGRHIMVLKRYTKSLHRKANLYKDLCGWKGKPLSEAECESFDLELMLGKNCQVMIEHVATADGSTFSAIQFVHPPQADVAPLEVPGDYVRVQDRESKREQDTSFDPTKW